MPGCCHQAIMHSWSALTQLTWWHSPSGHTDRCTVSEDANIRCDSSLQHGHILLQVKRLGELRSKEVYELSLADCPEVVFEPADGPLIKITPRQQGAELIDNKYHVAVTAGCREYQNWQILVRFARFAEISAAMKHLNLKVHDNNVHVCVFLLTSPTTGNSAS